MSGNFTGLITPWKTSGESATARLNLNHRVTPRLHKSSYEATLSPVIESIGRYCLLREPKMRQSRRIFLARLGAVALAVQARSFHALSSMADRLAWQREAKFGMFTHWGPYSVAGAGAPSPRTGAPGHDPVRAAQ